MSTISYLAPIFRGTQGRSAVSFLLACVVMFSGIIFHTPRAEAARTTVSATLNGGSSVTVAPGESITVVVTGNLSSGDDWEGTEWRINTSAPGSMTCENTPDHNSNGTHYETFTVTAPSSVGTYNAYFRISGTDNCSSQSESLLTMTGAVTVAYPTVSVPFSDSFGTSDQNDIPTWDEEGNDNGAATGVVGSSSGEDQYRSSGNPKFAKIAKDEWICLNLDASDDAGLTLSYWWKGDSDAESNDYGIVEYKAGSGDCGASGWTQLQSHALDTTSWQERTAFALPGALDNTTFRLRFRTDSSQGDEYFRVDDVTVTTGPTTGTLVVQKVLVNDNGGTTATSSFAFQVDGGSAQYFESDGENSVTVSAGTHTVTEVAVSGYATSYANCTNVSVPAGGSATCVITNNDIAPTLTVTKIVQNNDGGTLAVGDFPLFVNSNPVTSGVTSTYAAGAYTVSETNQSGYVGTFGGDCNASGTVTLAVGEVKSCTLTNDDVSPGLTVVKQVVNDNGGTAQVSDFTLYVGTTTATSGQTMTLPAGTYTVSESGGPSGYTASFSGDCDANGNVTLAVGATSTYACVITNDDVEPKLTVTKIVQGGTAQISDFPLFVGATQVTSSQQYGFSAGSYTVSEIAGNLPYFATFGGDCASNGSITLAPGDVRSCTIMNEYLAPPVASPGSGTYDDPQSVALSTTGPSGTTVRYTTDGGAPSCASAEYASPILVTGDTPLRAVACYGSVQSSPIWENYVIGPHSSGAGQTSGGGEVLGASTSTEEGGGTSTSTTTSTGPFSPPLVEVLGASTEAPACVSEGEYLRDYLWYGRPNDAGQVKKLQGFLNTQESAALPVTGFFGTLTRAAVSAFQVKYAADILTPWGETEPTGNVYKTTKWKINSLWCPELELIAPSVP